jgi:hypothetical protein
MPAILPGHAIRAVVADFLNAERIATHADLNATGGAIRVCSYVRVCIPNCPADNMVLYNEVKAALRALIPE